MSNLEISFINFVTHSSILLLLILLINRLIKQEYLQLRSQFLKLTLGLLFLLPAFSWFAPEKIKTIELPKPTTESPMVRTSLTLTDSQFQMVAQQASESRLQSLWKSIKLKTVVFVFLSIGGLLLLKEIIFYKCFLRKLKSLPEVELPYSTLFKKVKSGKQFKSPYIIGLKDPLLVLPSELVGEAPAVLRSILLHEEEHLKNGDNRMAVYERILFCIYYWNPLYWLFLKSNSEVQELLADTAVLKEINSKVYAGILLKLSEQQSTEEEVNSAALAISSSVTYKRIKKIISQGEKMNTRPTILGKALWSMLFVGACVLAISCQSIEKEKSVFKEPRVPAGKEKSVFKNPLAHNKANSVFIRAAILEVTLTEKSKLGFDAAAQKRFGEGNCNSLLKKAGVKAPLKFAQLVAGKENVRVLYAPQILSFDGEEAEVIIGDDVPIRRGSTTTDGTVEDKIENIQTGMTLQVTPQINADKNINLLLITKISGISGDSSVEGIESPVILQRSVTTNLIFKENETILLGGIIGKEKDKTKETVIFLSASLVKTAKDVDVLSQEWIE